MEAAQRVLIYLPNWIGDAVMALPAVLRLAAARPACQWLLLAHPRVRPLFEGFDEPLRLLESSPPQDSAWRSFRRSAGCLRAEGIDAAILLSGSARAAALTRAAGIPRIFGWPEDGRLLLLTDPVRRPSRRVHQRSHYLRLAGSYLRRTGGQDAIALPGSVEPPRLPLRPEELVWARRWRADRGLGEGEAIALAPGATYGPTKRWPEERFLDLARRLAARGRPLLWLGGTAEAELCERLARACPGSLSVAGLLSLRETLALLAGCRLVVSNDSGAMHLAQAAGAPTVGIFGSTDPAWTGPVGAGAEVVRRPVPCAPCFRPRCPYALECLEGIEVDEVERAVARALARAQAGEARPALFLDRDGVLIEEVNYLCDPAQVRLVPGAAAALRRQQAAGRALVVVTNQSAVARGMLDLDGLRRIHARLDALLRAEGVRLDGLEYCPHHPEFTGRCACRKPEPGMLLRAAHRHGLDLPRSWMIGDTLADLEAGRAAGCRVALVRTGHGRDTETVLSRAAEAVADRIADDLPALLGAPPEI